MTIFSEVNPARARFFLRHICSIEHRKTDKEDAKTSLFDQVESLKHYLRSREFQKKELEKGLDSLQEQISAAVEKGSKVTRYTINTTQGIAAFYRKIDQLESAIDAYLDSYHGREKRIHELEKRIVNEANTDAEPHIKKLKELEKKFIEMESLNKFDIAHLNRIRVKIEFLKNKAKKKLDS